MDIKKTANLLLNFTLNRLAEISGIIIFSAGILLFIALFSYSPEDPNFIFPKDTKKTIKKESGTTIRHKGPIRINPNNPKKVNSKSWIAYEAYKKAKSYEELKELGGESKH